MSDGNSPWWMVPIGFFAASTTIHYFGNQGKIIKAVFGLLMIGNVTAFLFIGYLVEQPLSMYAHLEMHICYFKRRQRTDP